jgi:hypothetical protein
MVNIKISPLVAWLAILVAVAIFAKVFWLVSTVQPILKQPSSERMMQTQEIESPAVSELEVPSAQESADWKVYHDDDFFFDDIDEFLLFKEDDDLIASIEFV